MSGTHRSRIFHQGPGPHHWAAQCRACGWSTSFGVSQSRGVTKGYASWRIVRERANKHYVERCAYDVFKPQPPERDPNATEPAQDF